MSTHSSIFENFNNEFQIAIHYGNICCEFTKEEISNAKFKEITNPLEFNNSHSMSNIKVKHLKFFASDIKGNSEDVLGLLNSLISDELLSFEIIFSEYVSKVEKDLSTILLKAVNLKCLKIKYYISYSCMLYCTSMNYETRTKFVEEKNQEPFLAYSIGNFPKLRELDLSENFLIDDYCFQLVNYIRNTNLQNINLSLNNLGIKTAVMLSFALNYLPIEEINLDNNLYFDDICFKILTAGLVTSKTMKKLSMLLTCLSNDTMKYIHDCQVLRIISLGLNPIQVNYDLNIYPLYYPNMDMSNWSYITKEKSDLKKKLKSLKYCSYETTVIKENKYELRLKQIKQNQLKINLAEIKLLKYLCYLINI
jgi:hypothetical protein